MNLFSYVDKYGNSSFEEMPFNEVDNAVFSSLSYVSLYGIVPSNRYNKIKIREASDKYFSLYPSNKKYIWAVKYAVKLFKAISNTRRYGDLHLYNYVYEASDEKQFSAVTIEITPKLLYVSFEGTDHLVSGWKEDFMMTYMFPVASQKKAIDYINRRFIFDRKEIILGGHSKGGNLAMVAGMYANIFVRNKIIRIYNNDGPGLLREYFESKEYERIKDKLVSIIPNYSVVGLLLYHDNDYVVVRASKKGAMSHDIHTWVVADKSFMRAELDCYSKTLEIKIINWLNKYTKLERKRFVFAMFDIFYKAKVESLMEIVENKMIIFELISRSRELDEVDRKMLRDFIGMLFNSFKEIKIDEFKRLFEKKVKVE